ncbi:VanW family protein [Candidatus Uhrbacteria bacterium]|nr:VanW family protein [Candidatus Uhrbacteria bacterium]
MSAALSRLRIASTLGWSIAAALVLFLLCAMGVGAIAYDRAYRDRMFPGVHIGPVDVGGLGRDAATARVRRAVDTRLASGFTYTLDGRSVTVTANVSAPADPDISYALIDVDVPELVDNAYAIGRESRLTTQWTTRIRGVFGRSRTIPIAARIDADRLSATITENFIAELPKPQDPRLIRTAAGGTAAWRVIPGRAGRELLTDIATATARRVTALSTDPIILTARTVTPTVTPGDIERILPQLNAALARTPLIFTYEKQQWTAESETVASWLSVLVTSSQPQPVLHMEALDRFLAPMASTIERPAENARLAIDPTTRRVQEFQSPREGFAIDRSELSRRIAAALFENAEATIPLPTTITAPAITLGDTNDLGIRERLGMGSTSFRGSPVNRKHNIRVGAELLNGLLIAPGEEFSTVGALSPFDDTRGYKPELVIKGNRTTPEFGGGLCQVSTTLFRTVLNAGLPVTERSNHAYRVSYYEPPVGMDATIYGPKPDFKFVNNTGAHLLLRTRVVGTTLEYEFWGTNDGRTATSSEPEVFNFREPPPIKTIETEDLKPGEKKCTEKAHTGVDARFTYTVTAADGTKTERVFNSHYRPWQAVCLVGKDPNAASPPPSIPDGSTAPALPPSAPSPTTLPSPEIAPPTT